MNEETSTTKTEQKILDAAKHVFMKNGLENSKMQDIATMAGISRTSLNYYFRTKENLFAVLVDQLFETLIPEVEGLISTDSPFVDKIGVLVDVYDSQIRKNDFIPRFVVVESQRNPEFVRHFIQKNSRIQVYLQNIIQTLQKEMDKGSIRKLPVEQLFTTFFGQVFTPYLLNALIVTFLDYDDEKKQEFYNIHKENTKRLLVDFLKADTQ